MTDAEMNLLLDRLVLLARNPTEPEMDSLKSAHRATLAAYDRIDADNAKMRERERKAEPHLTELYNAAKDYAFAPGGYRGKKARIRLNKAVKAAEPFVDHIPF